MKKRLLPVLLILLVFLVWIPHNVSADENLSIKLGQHLPVTVQPGETISISFDLRNDASYTWEDCVIVLEDYDWLEIIGCEGGITYGNTADRCYVQFKSIPQGTILIHNYAEEDVASGTVLFAEVEPVESFSIDNAPSGWGDGWCGRVVGGDTYFGDYQINEDYFFLETTILPKNHEECYITKWTSSNTDVATVDGAGAIWKLQPGSTTITATLSNGMIATYNLVIVEPEILYPGYQKTITFNPGECCDFLFDVKERGKYSFYVSSLNGSFIETFHIGYDGRQEFTWDYVNNYEVFTFDLSPELSPLNWSLGYDIRYDNGSPINTNPKAITIHFVKGSPEDNPFLDVPTGSWYETPVLWALENGITDGTSDTEFSPDDFCTRGQVVTFLWRAAGEPKAASKVNPFVDVKSTDYYYDAVLWAVEKGITDGMDDTHFEPKGDCSRSQVVTFLYRAFNKPPVGNAGNPFVDVPAADWFTAPVLWAVKEGITDGVTEIEFRPKDVCKRGQVVTFLYRAYN